MLDFQLFICSWIIAIFDVKVQTVDLENKTEVETHWESVLKRAWRLRDVQV